MSQDTIRTLRLIYRLTKDKKPFIFWLIIRIISALFPIATIYFFSQVIRAIENKDSLNTILLTVVVVFISRLLDNYTRIISTKKLDYIIVKIQLDIQEILVSSIKTEDKKMRHKAVQSVRNFADASVTMLSIFKQPGIDALVSFFAIPAILLVKDFAIFILQLAYVISYYFIDIYTTGRYVNFKNKHNSRIESYYAKLQTTKNFKYESTTLSSITQKLHNWGITEWFLLQNTAVIFYVIALAYLVYSVSVGLKPISDLVLIIGYIDSTQVFLNNISGIKDSMADTKVALHRLLDDNKSLAVDYDDLTT